MSSSKNVYVSSRACLDVERGKWHFGMDGETSSNTFRHPFFLAMQDRERHTYLNKYLHETGRRPKPVWLTSNASAANDGPEAEMEDRQWRTPPPQNSPQQRQSVRVSSGGSSRGILFKDALIHAYAPTRRRMTVGTINRLAAPVKVSEKADMTRSMRELSKQRSLLGDSKLSLTAARKSQSSTNVRASQRNLAPPRANTHEGTLGPNRDTRQGDAASLALPADGVHFRRSTSHVKAPPSPQQRMKAQPQGSYVASSGGPPTMAPSPFQMLPQVYPPELAQQLMYPPMSGMQTPQMWYPPPSPQMYPQPPYSSGGQEHFRGAEHAAPQGKKVAARKPLAKRAPSKKQQQEQQQQQPLFGYPPPWMPPMSQSPMQGMPGYGYPMDPRVHPFHPYEVSRATFHP